MSILAKTGTKPEVKAPPAAMAPMPSFAQKLLLIVEELTRLMDIETPLIRSREYDKHPELIARKQELSMDYQSALKAVADNPSLMAGLTTEQKLAMKESGKKLDIASRANAEAIRLAHIATERLLQAVMDEVRKDLHNQGGYSQRGMLAAAESAKSRPVAYSQRI